MMVVNSGAVNYVLTTMDTSVRKIINSPSASNKFMGLVSKISAACDLYFVGETQEHPICNDMKGATRLIGFCNLYTSIMWWVYLFSKDNLDQEALRKSLESACQKAGIEGSEAVAGEVLEKVMARQSFNSKGQVLSAVKEEILNVLKSNERTLSLSGKIEEIAQCVLIQQKARSFKAKLCSACFTMSNVCDGLASLNKWDILNLSHIANGLGKLSGAFSSVGTYLVLTESMKEVTILENKHREATMPAEKDAIYKALRNARLSVLSGKIDLVCTAVPLIFSLNPALVVAMAIISKGVGLVCFLQRN